MRSIQIRNIPNPFKINGRSTIEKPIDESRLELAYYLPEELKDSNHRFILASRGEVAFKDIDTLSIDPAGDRVMVIPNAGDPISVATAIMVVAAKVAVTAMISHFAGLAMGKLLGGQSKQPSFSGENDSMSSSPTYGWDGVQTLADCDIPVPVIYGENLIGGNYINVYVSNYKDKSYMYALFALGEGPLSEIAGITADTNDADLETIGEKLQINGNPVTNYEGVTVAVRMGTNDQNSIWFPPIDDDDASSNSFNELHSIRTMSDELASGDPYTFDTSVDRLVDAVRINFIVPALYHSKPDGTKTSTVRLKMEYKETGSSDDDYVVAIEEWIIGGKFFAPVRRSYRIDFAERGQYTVRVTKTSSDSDATHQRGCSLANIDEIQAEKLVYPNTALLALRIEATDQLSGSLKDVQINVKGLPVATWDTEAEEWVTQFSRNPVWCMLDALTNENYGVGKFIDSAYLNIDRFKTEAAYCDELVDVGGGTMEPRFYLDMVIDARMSAQDVMEKMGQACNAIMFWSSKSVQPIIDRVGTAVMMLTEGSTRNLQIEYKSARKTKNRVEIQFPNAAIQFRRDVIQAVDAVSISAGDPERTQTLHIPGITRQYQASCVGSYMIKNEKLVNRMITFEAGAKAAFLEPGDLFELSTQLVEWGIASGRIETAGNVVIPGVGFGDGWFTIRRDLTLESGKTYAVKIAYNADGTTEEYDVKMSAGTYLAGTQIMVDGTWTVTPSPFDEYAIGEDSQIVRPFRVMGIKRENNGTVTISASNYDENVYDTSDVIIDAADYSSLRDPRRIPEGPTNLTVRQSANWDATFTVAWQNSVDGDGENDDIVSHYEVYMSLDGGDQYELQGISNGNLYAMKNLVPGTHMWIKVLSVSRYGKRSIMSAAQVVEVWSNTVPTPGKIEGLELFGQGNNATFYGKDAKFTWREISYSSGTDFLGDRTQLGAGAGSMDKYFQDYEIEIYVSGIRVRREYVAKNEYTYTHEKNAEDNGGQAVRTFTLKVKQRNVYNMTSVTPAQLTVTNPKPAAPTNFTVTGTSFTNPDNALETVVTENITWDVSEERDVVGYRLWRKTGLITIPPWDFDPTDDELIYDGPWNGYTNTYSYEVSGGSRTVWKVAAYDVFGKEYPLNYASET